MNDVIGQQFGKWTVVALAAKRGGRTYVLCRCECGREYEVRLTRMRCGYSSCCKHCRKIIHGAATPGYFTAEYLCWQGIKQRCFTINTSSSMWMKYAGRGITMCDRWKHSFAAFLEDMGPKPSPSHSIDRYPNQMGNYEPGNCRWATRSEQQVNRRRHTDPTKLPRGDAHWTRKSPERAADVARRNVVHKRGEDNPKARLAEIDVQRIKRRIEMGEPDTAIAASFGVQPGTIWFIRTGKNWGHVA